jgi:signal transduction histidine kinase
MASLIGLVIAAFVAVAYREVRTSLVQAAAVRAQATADQLAGLFVQMTQQRLIELQRLAGHPSVRAIFENGDNAAIEAARAHLGQIRSPGSQVLEVWNISGQCLLTIATPPAASDLPSSGAMPAGSGASPLRRFGDHIYGESVAEIAGEGGRLGFLVVRRPLNGAQVADLLNRIVGQGASISLGNKAGDVWTDLSKAMAPPSVNLSRPGVAQTLGPNGPAIGALSEIRGTPWSMWVEFPQAQVLAPARAFLRRVLLVALVLVVLSAIGAGIVSARLTTPLHELTLASEAIAAGDYARRVTIDRRDELGRLSVAFNTMTQRVEGAHHDLEQRVQERTAELESFSYSVSHDLRAPLRHITGFANMLREAAGPALGAEAGRHLTTIVDAASRMGRLIDDLLAFSRVGRTQLARSAVDLNRVVQDAKREVSADINGRVVNWRVQALPVVEGDPALLRLVFVNLLSNALKYTARRSSSEIEVGVRPERGDAVVFVRDNGVGFDMQYAHKLFGVFQRLHSSDDFEGTGIGLANVRRIVQRHGGRTWAEGAVDAGATFFISLPQQGTGVSG